MKNENRLIKMFGFNEAGIADLPNKISGTRISRIIIGEESGCSFCFPHGFETINSNINNRQRCWKKHRKAQWKKI